MSNGELCNALVAVEFATTAGRFCCHFVLTYQQLAVDKCAASRASLRCGHTCSDAINPAQKYI
jgi:hypothetical protein